MGGLHPDRLAPGCPGGWCRPHDSRIHSRPPRTGLTCGTPRLRALQKLQAASESIARLCNVCEEKVTMQRDDWRIYRIPQPLQKDTGLVVKVRECGCRVGWAHRGVPPEPAHVLPLAPRP